MEEMNDALNSGSYEGPDGEQYSSRLEYEMEKLYTQKANENYEVKQYESFQQLTAERQQRQLTISEANAQTSRMNAINAQNQGRTQTERENIQTANYLAQSEPPPTIENINLPICNVLSATPVLHTD